MSQQKPKSLKKKKNKKKMKITLYDNDKNIDLNV